jgi:hypothetical protein
MRIFRGSLRVCLTTQYNLSLQKHYKRLSCQQDNTGQTFILTLSGGDSVKRQSSFLQLGGRKQLFPLDAKHPTQSIRLRPTGSAADYAGTGAPLARHCSKRFPGAALASLTMNELASKLMCLFVVNPVRGVLIIPYSSQAPTKAEASPGRQRRCQRQVNFGTPHKKFEFPIRLK